MKLIHLSDLHVSTRNDLEYRATRRIVLDIITRHRDAVICITGDFVNNGTLGEYDVITGILAPLVNHCRLVMTCPGNHDVRWAGSLGTVHDGPFLQCRRNLTQAHTGFPYVQMIDGVQIIALDSTEQARGIAGLARGCIGYRQRMELATHLEHGEPAARVVMLHHHPFDRGLGLELVDADELLATLAGRCDLLLFGHQHKSAQWRDVYGVGWLAAAGKSTADLSYRVFDITDGKISYTEEKL